MSVPSRNFLYYGKEDPPSRQVELQAGTLSAIFEPELAFLRRIRLDDREVIRGIYCAVRDRQWGTIMPRVFDLDIQKGPESFSISFWAECKKDDIDFLWKGLIRGDAPGLITFSMEGTARRTFWRNRIGFCVLHPIRECAGKPCVIEKTDGRREKGVFPYRISPHQPFQEIRAIAHKLLPNLSAEIRMEGDVFEMEDQRNWTDASYKTYCTPSSLPFPAQVKKGTSITQSVALALRGQISRRVSSLKFGAGDVTVSIAGAASTEMPRIGLCLSRHERPLYNTEKDLLTALNPAHLRVDLRLSEPGYRGHLRRAASEVNSLGLPLELALFCTDQAEDELRGLLKEVRALQPQIAAWLIFHVQEKSTRQRWAALARQILTGYDSGAKFGAGSSANFTELNRERPPVQVLDLVCYSANPQVHAFDNKSLVEALEMLGQTVANAREFSNNLPVAVTPLTLCPRPRADVRQRSLFGAGWTLGSLKYLCESGAHSITFFETTGSAGVMEGGSTAFPLYHVLADAGEFAGGRVIPSRSNQPLRAEVFAVRKGNRTCILLANLCPDVQLIQIRSAELKGDVAIRYLDEQSVTEAMRHPQKFRKSAGTTQRTTGGQLQLKLLPFAVARVDVRSDPVGTPPIGNFIWS
ncbi:MAG: hypothetical protein ACRD1R_16020 [Acidobacteriota bacterium]